jgi:hypothetical protein
MLTQNRADAQFLTSRALTVAIVASVVLINSVAWGIPLVVGGSRNLSPLLDGSRMTTGTVPKLEKAGERSTKITKQPHRSLVPLPGQAPSYTDVSSINSAKQVAGPVEPLTVTPSRKPLTLFPQPEPRLKLPKPPRIAAAVHDRRSAKRQASPNARELVRDVVLVSPYTPGVRISPKGRGHEWHHRNLRVANGQTTLDTAKAIARRAARRFEQMRDKMARLDARNARGLRDGRTHRRALLPVASQPPRIAGYNSGRSASKSARSFVRARLVRRPLAGAAALRAHIRPVNTRLVHARPISRDQIPTNVNLRLTQSPVSGAFKLRQVARLMPVARRTIKRSRRSIARNRTGGKAKRSYRRKRRIVRRTAKVRHSQRRRRSRKVDGFRRGFHRQLVAANFFGNSN